MAAWSPSSSCRSREEDILKKHFWGEENQEDENPPPPNVDWTGFKGTEIWLLACWGCIGGAWLKQEKFTLQPFPPESVHLVFYYWVPTSIIFSCQWEISPVIHSRPSERLVIWYKFPNIQMRGAVQSPSTFGIERYMAAFPICCHFSLQTCA